MPGIDKAKFELFRKGQIKFTRLFHFDGNQVASLLLCGYNLFTEGRLREARSIFEGLNVLDPDLPYVNCILGAIYQRWGELDRAILHYDRAIQLFPSDVVALTNRAEIYLSQGKFGEAASDLQRVIEIDPQDKNAAARRARLLAAVTSESLLRARKLP